MIPAAPLPHADSTALRRAALAHLESGDAATAQTLLRQGAARAPLDSDVQELLGVAECSGGEYERGIGALSRAVELAPARAAHRINLGKALRDGGRAEEALLHLQMAVRLAPSDAAAWHHLGLAHLALGAHDEAVSALTRAGELDRTLADAAADLGNTLALQGRIKEAHATYHSSLTRARDDGMLFRSATLLPPIMESVDAIGQWRERFAQGLSQMAEMRVRLSDPVVQAGVPGFFLAYHGQCNRELMTSCAAVLREAAPELVWRAPQVDAWRGPRDRIRVGFLSRYLREHSIGRTSRGLIANLDRKRFEAFALRLPPAGEDALAQAIRSGADRTIDLPADLPGAREQIAALDLDVLFYQDIGMEPVSYYLAFARLAPVQCVSFGHPDTTGLAEMDWFVSNDWYEEAEADADYSERLFLLRGLPTLACYDRPPPPLPGITRASLGLPEGRTLYVCPQTLFKLHPGFDEMLLRLLESDPQGDLVLVRPQVASWLQLVLQRLHRRAPWALERVHVVPMLERPAFLALLEVCDVVLDTPHFNGMNSSLEAFSVGAPVVTLPGTLQRGRHTAAMYRAMGLTAGVAATPEAYVETALALGLDRDRREDLRSSILGASGVLFDNTQVVREFERFFAAAIEQRMRA